MKLSFDLAKSTPPFLYLGILGSILALIIVSSSKFSAKYDTAYWQKEFPFSQVVMGGKATHFLSDEELYAILGYKYVRGEDPAKLHAEVPPLGKYLIGLSIITFGNENIVNLILGLLSLILLYQIGLVVLKQKTLALLAVLLESLDSEFRYLVTTSNLDVPQIFLISFSMLMFIKGLKNHRLLPLASLSLGLLMATKFYFNGILLGFVYFLFLLINRKFTPFVHFTLSLPWIAVGYILPYLVTIVKNPDIIEFLKFQRYLTSWWAGNARVPFGGIWSIITTGWWRTWWEGPTYIKVAEWNFLWPTVTALGLLSIIKIIKSKNQAARLSWLWCATYLTFASFISAFPRYLLAVFPFLSVLAIFWLTDQEYNY